MGLPRPDGIRRFVAVGAGILLLVGALALLRTLTAPGREVAHLQSVRTELRAARLVVDSCSAAISSEEASFQAYDERVDSLRRAVRAYESTHADGVPADSYDAYLSTFDRYNESVPDWRTRADSLRAHWADCRALARRHNVLADSLRRLLLQRRDRR